MPVACHKKAQPTAAGLTLSMPAPARPAEVLAELCVPSPSAVWPALRGLLGDLGSLAPSSPELALASWLSVPALSANSFDFGSPLVAVWSTGDHGGWVVGVHLESGPEFVAKLTTGSAPSHRLENKAGLSLFRPISGAAASGPAVLAVVSDTLLLGPERAVERAGLYVARGLAPAARRSGPISLLVPGAAWRASAIPLLRAAWAGRRHVLEQALVEEQQQRGRPADLADPAVVLSSLDALAESTISTLNSVEELQGELALANDQVELSISLKPTPRGAAAALGEGLALGGQEPLRELPANTAVALLVRRERVLVPSPPDFLTGLFGSRLKASDTKAVAEAWQSIQLGAGGGVAYALLDDWGWLIHGEVLDSERLRRGIGEGLGLLERAPFSSLLGRFWGQPRINRKVAATSGRDAGVERTLIQFAPRAGAVRRKVAPFEIDSLVEPTRFVVAAAGGGEPPLARVRGNDRSPALLEENAALTRLLGSRKVAYLAFADLARLGAPTGGQAAPVVLALGARERVPELSFAATFAAFRGLVMWELSP